MKFATAFTAVAALLPTTLACNGYTGGLPTPVGTKTNSKVIEVAAGAVFDGAWYRYDRGSGACNGNSEGGKQSFLLLSATQCNTNECSGAADAVFLLNAGATLRNVIIGKNQAEGVHCKGHCTLEVQPDRQSCTMTMTNRID